MAKSVFGNGYSDEELYYKYSDSLVIDYIEDPVAYVNKSRYDIGVTDIPIRKDLTSSYLQIIGLLSEDEELLNLSNMLTDKPVDWGTDIANKITRETGVGVTRSDVKMVIMRLVYGSSVSAMVKKLPLAKRMVPRLVVGEMKLTVNKLSKYSKAFRSLLCLDIDLCLITNISGRGEDSKEIYNELKGIINRINGNIVKVGDGYKIDDKDKFIQDISNFRVKIVKLNEIYNIIELLFMIHKPLRKTKHLVRTHYLIGGFLVMPIKAYIIEKKRHSFVLLDRSGGDISRRFTHVTPYVTDQLDLPKT